MYLIFDTETTGLPKRWDAPLTDFDNWPRCIQIAWQLHDEMGNLVENQDFLVQADGFNIPFDAEKIHGISTALANEEGVSLQEVLDKFEKALQQAKYMVGQNVGFDLNIMGAEFLRENREVIPYKISRCWIPVQKKLPTCVNSREVDTEGLNFLLLQNFTRSFSMNLLLKRITQRQMWRPLPGVSWN
jgi:DNA polymerase III epsilon subunit-like protein